MLPLRECENKPIKDSNREEANNETPPESHPPQLHTFLPSPFLVVLFQDFDVKTVTEAELTYDVPFKIRMERDDYVHG